MTSPVLSDRTNPVLTSVENCLPVSHSSGGAAARGSGTAPPSSEDPAPPPRSMRGRASAGSRCRRVLRRAAPGGQGVSPAGVRGRSPCCRSSGRAPPRSGECRPRTRQQGHAPRALPRQPERAELRKISGFVAQRTAAPPLHKTKCFAQIGDPCPRRGTAADHEPPARARQNPGRVRGRGVSGAGACPAPQAAPSGGREVPARRPVPLAPGAPEPRRVRGAECPERVRAPFSKPHPAEGV